MRRPVGGSLVYRLASVNASAKSIADRHHSSVDPVSVGLTEDNVEHEYAGVVLGGLQLRSGTK